MTDRERLSEIHLCLDGAVDQLGAGHRIAVGNQAGQASPYTARIERLFADAVALRNEVRDQLLNQMGKPT